MVETNDGTDNPNLTITNSQIYNSSNIGILANNANITGENLVINNAGQASFRCILGGSYTFAHCTFATYSSIGAFREFPTMSLENSIQINASEIIAANLNATFTNSIIYGDKDIELLFGKNDDAAFNYTFKNCLIRFNDISDQFENDPLYDFANTSLFDNVILNEDPGFKDPQKNMLSIGEESAANGKASVSTVTKDILGTTRSTSAPDMGAYESMVFEEEKN